MDLNELLELNRQLTSRVAQAHLIEQQLRSLQESRQADRDAQRALAESVSTLLAHVDWTGLPTEYRTASGPVDLRKLAREVKSLTDQILSVPR